MPNELLLLISIAVDFGGVLFFYRAFGRTGMYAWTVLTVILANIEVCVLIRAFGMDQTLGNILFATSYIATDILSENHGDKDAVRAVKLGIAASAAFMVITWFWRLYTPAEADTAMSSVRQLFSGTPRLVAASFVTYAICQRLDVWLYQKVWKITAGKSGDRKRFLWLRNNAATLVSQALNAILFNIAAFAGIYDTGTLVTVIVSTYVIYAAAAVLDTPVVYLARKMRRNND